MIKTNITYIKGLHVLKARFFLHEVIMPSMDYLHNIIQRTFTKVEEIIVIIITITTLVPES